VEKVNKKSEICFAHIPLGLYGTIPVGVGRDVFILICYRAKMEKSIIDLRIPDKYKKKIGLNRLSYYRGIKVLMRLDIIAVHKNSYGSAYLITLNAAKLDDNTLKYIHGGLKI